MCVCVVWCEREREETPLCSSGLHWTGPVDARHSNDSITTREPFFSLLSPSHSLSSLRKGEEDRTGLGSEEIFSSCHPNTKDLLPPSFSTSLFSLPTPTPTLAAHTKRETTTLTHTHTSFSLTPLSHTPLTLCPRNPRPQRLPSLSSPRRVSKYYYYLVIIHPVYPTLIRVKQQHPSTHPSSSLYSLPHHHPIPLHSPPQKNFFFFFLFWVLLVAIVFSLSCFSHKRAAPQGTGAADQ